MPAGAPRRYADRDARVLRAWADGKSHAEISTLFGLKFSNISNIVRRQRERLRETAVRERFEALNK